VPELPEVEVTRRRIEPLLVGRTIRRVRTTADSYFFLTPTASASTCSPCSTTTAAS
jgi:formamidopyrimidine-DNA glycosylase